MGLLVDAVERAAAAAEAAAASAATPPPILPAAARLLELGRTLTTFAALR